MAELKTKKNDASVSTFLQKIPDPQRREDAMAVAALMKTVTKKQPKMWGSSIVGFGSYHYKYASGREGDWFAIGLSPRKDSLTVYISRGFRDYPELMDTLGKYTTGQSCLYIKKLEDVDQKVLKQLMTRAFKAGAPA
jgi:hypothetical protein